MSALLALADGTIFEGTAFGAATTVVGEVVFNTSLTGYQEVITDPSYRGQMVCMTVPHVGNTGINACLLYTSDVYKRQIWRSGRWRAPAGCLAR